MNISFNDVDRMSPNSFNSIAGSTTEYGSASKAGSIDGRGFSLDITSNNVTDNKAYRDQGRSIEEVMMSAQATDLEARRDYMTVMSNCVSDEDFAKMQKDGFDPGDVDFTDTVTILDHIKTAMIKGGAEVKGYTDTISDEALLNIAGSEAYASELKGQFEAKDIPLTEDNVNEITKSYEKLSSLNPLSESGTKYLVENNLYPSVDNLYTASYSAGTDASRQGHGYYQAGGVAGYYAKKPESVDVNAIMPQIENIIKDAGYEVSEENVKAATWLVEKGIPLTTDTFKRLENVTSVELPMAFGDFADHATDAILDGIKVSRADLSRNTSLRKEASDIYNEVQTEGTIKGRRVLEEVRLSMTVEANLKLLRSGFSIDTAPMEELIHNLKEIEKEFAINLTNDENEIDAVRKKNIFDDTLGAVENIKAAPISISYSFEYRDTLEIISTKADTLKADCAKANQSYEALMTAPRADMGDSIRKAFANVDDILNSENLALTDENRRAVRILGYNGIEINSDSIAEIREKDSLLQNTIRELTPGRVLKMIRDNVNPMTMPVEELDSYLKAQDTTKEDMLSYSRFLYKLEQSKGITEDEKSAYIGIYRLVRQIEKSDFSSIGAINEMNAEFNLENMLSALRSRRHKTMDYKVDDTFGGVTALDRGIESITSQIAKGFMPDTTDIKNMLDEAGSREAERQYEQQLYEEIRSAYKVEASVLEELQNMGMPVTANNITDMQTMMNSPASVFTRLRDIGYRRRPDKEIKLEGKKEAQESYKEFTGSIKDFLDSRVFGSSEESRALKSMDIRQMSRIYQHMDFLERQSEEENYEIPAEIGGNLTAINLKVIHEKDAQSKVAISFESITYGEVAASFRMTGDGLEGICSVSAGEGGNALRENEAVLRNALESEGIAYGRMDIVSGSKLNINDFNLRETRNRETDSGVISTDTLYKAAKVFIGFAQDTAE